MQLRFKVCQSRVNDAKRKFILAAFSYYELSQSGQYDIDEDDLLQLLKCAVTCAILAPAGPQKARILTLLYKDERSQKLESFEILQNMFMERVIKPDDVKKFSTELADHQKVTTSDGYTVLEKATLEHNISVISKIYTNISFEELGRFLGIETSRAEKLIAGMVTEKRISASLDQMNEAVNFESEQDSMNVWN